MGEILQHSGTRLLIDINSIPAFRRSQAHERCNGLTNIARRGGGTLVSRTQAFSQILHQPCGLTEPSTLLQAFGAWNRRQLEQLWLPFGLG